MTVALATLDPGPEASSEAQACRWLYSSGKPPHLYCNRPQVDGRPYCVAHCARAYVPAPPLKPAERMRT